jgi:methylated-DNA-[protein]-cysteine S-methyltransferase
MAGKPQEYFHIVFKTVAGWVGLLGSEAGIRIVTLPQLTAEEAKTLLHFREFSSILSDSFFQDLTQRIENFYEGIPVIFSDRLDLSDATPFQRSVWQATRTISYGETRSYSWVAGKIGKPNASRAVGQALHRNPLPVIVPCHRVVGSNGQLVGFGGGIDLKRRLLELER